MDTPNSINFCPAVKGHLELLMGCMASGKSTEGVKRYRRFLQYINPLEIAYINHLDDTRYGEGVISTHDKIQVPSLSITKLMDFHSESWKDKYKTWKLIIIEEAQFFPDLKEFVLRAVDEDHKKVIVIGLDGDSDRNTFGEILSLIPYADEYHKLKAICNYCQDGTEAIFTRRIVNSKVQKLVGTLEMYKPVCRYHFNAKIEDLPEI